MSDVGINGENRVRPYYWDRPDDGRWLTARQARAIAASEHCTESAYIHPAGQPELILTTPTEIETYERAAQNGH